MINSNKNYINVNFEDKDLAKKLGAKWDNERKSWFYYDNEKLAKISKWFPTSKNEPIKIAVPKKIHFFTGEEILNFLGYSREEIQFSSHGFCSICDSVIANEWIVNREWGQIDIYHHSKWDYLNSIEKAILYHYLYITEPCKTESMLHQLNAELRLCFEETRIF